MPTSQQRWDRAYQLLLQWAATASAPTAVLASPILPEDCHACSDLRSRFEIASVKVVEIR